MNPSKRSGTASAKRASNSTIQHNDVPSKRTLTNSTQEFGVTYDDILKKRQYPDTIIINIINDFYRSFEFRWCCGIEKQFISRNKSEIFKKHFDNMLNCFEKKVNLTKTELKNIFKNFTNSNMFERIYYRTNPITEHDVDDIYKGINGCEHMQFIQTFWDSISKICDHYRIVHHNMYDTYYIYHIQIMTI